ncbi:hypothetical protein PAT01_31310 [Pseudoalteromonas atlantica]|uniref:Prepilin-type N-terminal cleavage/methylation domain-containing protein n=1 Tax=Pseudoalteromonas atlantica TaxID=288 RepID=A0ABQ0UHB3_PSEAF|nr:MULTISPECIES: prepilin-type N-terminal cleavage/methylation domain-containing protein [unclassified Pseudoalteromonas]MCK8095609.1 prepilin-type N-terminal cleavage/methylation domain-containing protein [Pseudoalteromonas sp. 1CM17D]TMO06492.1 hypothetical protein CWB60_09865 [Pseudoalteromonas sp. S327]TMO19805.1 hypothetical protein CWB59_03670 [Pseudoalteromonas sp. S326]GEK77827.1 hypothetical protein PAT01_31310 [Pseudoalteromonas atlantica]
MSHSKYKGFTLIELLIVLVLIGLATSFVLPNMWKQFDQAKLYSEKKQLYSIITFAKEYSVYKGGSLKLVLNENTLRVYEQKIPQSDAGMNEIKDETKNLDDEQNLQDENKDAENLERLIKKIEFNKLTLQDKSFIFDAQSYFNKVVITIGINGTQKREKIEI